MSARLVWIATCEICETTSQFDGLLSVPELGNAARAAGWELPCYGGMFCARCARAVTNLSRNRRPEQ
jgi:hypothetical protein